MTRDDSTNLIPNVLRTDVHHEDVVVNEAAAQDNKDDPQRDNDNDNKNNNQQGDASSSYDPAKSSSNIATMTRDDSANLVPNVLTTNVQEDVVVNEAAAKNNHNDPQRDDDDDNNDNNNQQGDTSSSYDPAESCSKQQQQQPHASELDRESENEMDELDESENDGDDDDDDDGVLLQQPVVIGLHSKRNGSQRSTLPKAPPPGLQWQEDAILQCFSMAVDTHNNKSRSCSSKRQRTWEPPAFFTEQGMDGANENAESSLRAGREHDDEDFLTPSPIANWIPVALSIPAWAVDDEYISTRGF